jgi:chromosomal replication initiator protein
MDRSKLFVSRVSQNNQGQTGEDTTAPIVWNGVLDALRAAVPALEFDRWIAELRLVAEVDGVLLIAAREPYDLERINRQFARDIERLWSGLDPLARPVRMTCWRAVSEELRGLVGDPWAEPSPEQAQSEPQGSRTFSNLVVGASNQIAVELAKRIAAGLPNGTSVSLLYGPPGTGKTHTALALKEDVAARDPKRKVVYLTAEEFMSTYLEGVRAGDTTGLKRRLRSAAILIIDDLHRIAGKPATETELCQNIREVTGNGGQVVLVGDAAPGQTVGFGARLRGEIKGATAVEVGLPDLAMRREILVRLGEQIRVTHPQFELTDEMVQKLNAGIRGPGRELTGAVWSLYTEARFGADAPTMEMLDRVIRRLAGEVREPTIDEIKKATLKVFPIARADLEGPSKAQAFVYPRKIAMYLCRTKTKKSYPQIGRAFGKRDHSTVIYAVDWVVEHLPTDPQLAKDIAEVEAVLLDILDNSAD